MTRSRFFPVGLALLLALGLLLPAAGCSKSGKNLKPDPSELVTPPNWALTGKTPDIQGVVCAVGVAGPTFFRTDAVEKAGEAARAELARTLSVRVQTAMLDIQSGGGGHKESVSVVQVSSYVNEVVLDGSRIIEVWYDEYGKGFAQKPQFTYALGCIESASISSIMPNP